MAEDIRVAERLRQLERPARRPPGGVVVAGSREDEREARVRECELTPRRQLLEKVDGFARSSSSFLTSTGAPEDVPEPGDASRPP